MASIFEEMMSVNHDLTESAKISRRKNNKVVKESRKISCKKLKVESRKFFEENDITDLEKDFEVPNPEEDTQDGVVLVIDPEIGDDEEVPEDAAEEMVGDLVYKCPVCGSNYVCDCNAEGMVEGVEVDEEGAPLECPICGDDADQILIGEITPAEDAPGEEKSEMEPQSVEEPEDGIEDPGESAAEYESLRKSLIKKSRIVKESVEEDNYEEMLRDPGIVKEIKEQAVEFFEEEGFEKGYGLPNYLDVDGDDFKNPYLIAESPYDTMNFMIEEGGLGMEEFLSDILEFDIYDLDDSDELVEKAEEIMMSAAQEYISPRKLHKVFSAVLNSSGFSETNFEKFIEINGAPLGIIYTGGGGPTFYIYDKSRIKDYLSSSSKSGVKESYDEYSDSETPLELEVPSDDNGNEEKTPQVVVKDSDVNLYFDEAKLEALMCRMMKENYKGAPQFKVNKVTLSGKKLKIEYVVRNRKKSRKGLLVGEGFSRQSRAFKLMLRDKGAFTESFARTPSFTVECVRMRNKIIPTKMNYDFKVKVNESLYRVVSESVNKR